MNEAATEIVGLTRLLLSHPDDEILRVLIKDSIQALLLKENVRMFGEAHSFLRYFSTYTERLQNAEDRFAERKLCLAAYLSHIDCVIAA